MPWASIIELILFILKLIFKVNATPSQKIDYLRRWRLAKKKAETTGDTSDLEALLADLAAKQ